MNTEKCVCCGAVIPEGRQVCPSCEWINCFHADNHGFCRKYSSYDVVWKCKGDGDCDGYKEAEDD